MPSKRRNATAKTKPTKARKSAKVVLLSGGNPQIYFHFSSVSVGLVVVLPGAIRPSTHGADFGSERTVWIFLREPIRGNNRRSANPAGAQLRLVSKKRRDFSGGI